MAAVAMSSPVQDTTSTTRATPTLLNIPAELRNKIYALVFELPINALTIESTDNHPSLDSILACRQLHSEFKHMYASTCRNYWPNKTMRIDLTNHASLGTAANDLCRTSSTGIRYIQRFIVFSADTWFDLEYDEDEDAWKFSASSRQLPWRATAILARHVNSILSKSEVEGEIGDPTRGLGLSAEYVVGIMEFVVSRITEPWLWIHGDD